MSFGGQSVTIRTYADGATRDRFNKLEQEPNDTVVTGVLMRPFRGVEDVKLTDVASETWRCTLPPVSAALTATATADLIYQGDPYKVWSVEPFSDLGGSVDHVRITCYLEKS